MRHHRRCRHGGQCTREVRRAVQGCAHLVADLATVRLAQALQHLPQRADGALLAQEALHVPRPKEEPAPAPPSHQINASW